MQMKKYLCAGLMLIVLILSSGCFRTYNMPFNGEIVFHDFSLTIPEDYIRDSTQSNDDLWSFEKGWYKKVIIIKRSDVSENEPEQLRELMEFYESIGGTTAAIDGYENAYKAEYTKDDVVCREVVFIYKNSVYAIAMRGVTEEEFSEFLSTVSIVQSSALEEATV